MTNQTKIKSVKGIILKSVKPPIAVGLEYQRHLVRMVRQLNKAVYQAISKTYAEFESDIALDASPVFQIEIALKKVFERYTSLFKKTGQSLAERFIGSVDKHDFRHMQKELAQHAITIRPDANYIGALNINKALIADNVNLITDLSEKQYQQIHGDLMRSIAKGGDLSEMEANLRKRGIQTEKRARRIAKDQLFKATGAIDNQRRLSNGITKSIWRHSRGDKQPRQSHLAADGRIYDNSKGCLIDKEYIYPGEKVNCTCYSDAYIPLDD